MQIEKVVEQKGGMFKIVMDNGDYFQAHEESLVRYRLMKGAEFDESEYERIMQAIQYDRAYVDALKYISYKLRSISEMRKYLSEDYTPGVISETVHRLKDEGYLNDSHYAEALKNTMLNTSDKGPGSLVRELKKHQVDQDIIMRTADAFDSEIDSERMNRIKSRELKRHKGAYRQFRMKLQEKLYQKGYNKDHMDMIAFDEDEFDETSHFEKDFEKYYNKYMKREGSYAARQKLIQALMRRGYNYDMIREKLGGIDDEFI
ncbi:MAG TPA: RecX family transcriptional regulator [Candidatus Salinicoccus stercoripullorum]|uniref:Regulatory protein RecX n=1 Tax=Candidatus Salinicoccus stercoripullorum TaxID=2838756 RepID=A0A9D1QFW3_9STAP|nr:RecX family transcriptional regulator [Candidatus Salinicoccus stercoripullorum]